MLAVVTRVVISIDVKVHGESTCVVCRVFQVHTQEKYT